MDVMEEDYFEQFNQQDIERIEENENDAVIGPDEAEEAVVTTRDVKPKKIILKPRLKLDDKRLKGPRGLSVLEPLFKSVTLKGPGSERKDLDTVMSLLEHWAHRLFPKMTFDDCLEKIEDLGHKKSVSSYVTLLRMDSAETAVETLTDDIIPARSPSPDPVIDPFDQLLDNPPQSQTIMLTQDQRERMERNQLIAMERRKARLKAKYEKTAVEFESATPVSIAEPMVISEFESISEAVSVSDHVSNGEVQSSEEPQLNSMTQDPSSSSELDPHVQTNYENKLASESELAVTLTQEQQERMERNRQIAMERRRARLKAKYESAADTSNVTAVELEPAVLDSTTEPMAVTECESTGDQMSASDDVSSGEVNPSSEPEFNSVQELTTSSELGSVQANCETGGLENGIVPTV